jgi:glucose/arabinose dehydrogenase
VYISTAVPWRQALRFTSAVVLVIATGVSVAGGSASATAIGPGRTLGLVPVASGLPGAVFVAAAPSRFLGRLYVVQRAGLIRIVDNGRVLDQPFLDIRNQVLSGGLRGLFSIAFHPDYLRNGLFYVNYVGRDSDIYISRFKAVHGVGAASSRRVLLRVAVTRKEAFGHYGGQLAFGPDDRLYASFGDGSQPEKAQDPTTLLGKLVRLDVDKPGTKPEIVAVGLRNPWRFSFDRGTGDLYIGDVGETRREETDRIPRGFGGIANLGWPFMEGSLRIGPVPADFMGRVVPPFLEYRHGRKRCYAVTGGYVYRGDTLQDVRGRYFYGDLCGGVWSVAVAGGVARDRRPEPLTPPGLLVSFGEGSRGELYVVALNGHIYEISAG